MFADVCMVVGYIDKLLTVFIALHVVETLFSVMFCINLMIAYFCDSCFIFLV